MSIPWRELNTSKIHVFHPECNGSGRFNLRCEYDNVDCFIQVPLSTIYQCDKKISVGFPYLADHRDKLAFVRKMEELDKWLCDQFKSLWKTVNPSIKRKKSIINWFPFVRRSGHTAYMSFHIQMERVKNSQGKIILRPILDVYDRQKTRIGSVESLEPYTFAYHIIHMDCIWVAFDTNENRWNAGMQWSVVQSRVYPSVFRIGDSCLIREDVDDFPDTKDNIPLPPPPLPSISREDDPIFGKYVKMRRMGIPDGAIHMKLTQDGLTMVEFERWLNNKMITAPKSAPTPPMTSVLSAIKNGSFALKKAEERLIPVALQIKDKFTPPSKDELMSILAKLKKVS
jgi:hypothetical protein